MTDKFQRKPKRGPALWTQIKSPGFQAQAAQIHPERSATGGIKAISGGKAVRDAVYKGIAELFKAQFPWCQTCAAIRGVSAQKARPTEDVHHSRGKVGLLLFHTKFFVPVCRPCHNWIGDNIEKARELGMICAKGEWNREDE